MTLLLKKVVSHKWKTLLATIASEMRRWRINARSPCGPPKLVRTILFCPHTCEMISGVRASVPRRRIENLARICANAFLSKGSLRGKTLARLVSETKSSSNLLTN